MLLVLNFENLFYMWKQSFTCCYIICMAVPLRRLIFVDLMVFWKIHEYLFTQTIFKKCYLELQFLKT